ncbi:MAG: DUF559 domain-containing protein [Propionibacteriaceae bacterium]|nr:DUF559 domain-containing protein [Propionibacteriaceae bacterium]
MGLVTCRNYEELGYRRVFHGVYDQARVDCDTIWDTRRATWLRKVKAVMVLYADRQPILYGPTALQVMSVALPESVEDWQNVHILFTQSGDRPNRQGVIAHSTNRPVQMWRIIHGLPVMHPVDHWLQISAASMDAMVEIGDGFLRRKNPLLSIEEMKERLSQLSGRPHSSLAAKAMCLVRPNTDSLYETRTRLMLVRAGLPTPEVNYAVRCSVQDRTYHVDMGYATVKVAVEYDGLVHIQDRQQMSIDANRRRILQDEGWLIITVTVTQLRNPTAIVHSVESALIVRGWRPTS